MIPHSRFICRGSFGGGDPFRTGRSTPPLCASRAPLRSALLSLRIISFHCGSTARTCSCRILDHCRTYRRVTSVTRAASSIARAWLRRHASGMTLRSTASPLLRTSKLPNKVLFPAHRRRKSSTQVGWSRMSSTASQWTHRHLGACLGGAFLLGEPSSLDAAFPRGPPLIPREAFSATTSGAVGALLRFEMGLPMLLTAERLFRRPDGFFFAFALLVSWVSAAPSSASFA
mmetsp:Transcript_12406/g.37272  ORF Transcript_12406/g.37272 Transcript_12406/m.37272 type:complete len:230 (-) Transcript_12406:1048-1737(-)